MPEYKKQHYVPKFYLRFFTVEGSNKYIKLCIKESRQIIQKVDLEGQAQESYFYGKDLEREKWFGNIEDKTADVLNRVIQSRSLPKNKSVDYYWIWTFMLLQAYRTRANADEYNEMVDVSLKTVMRFEQQFANFEFDKHFFAYDDAIEKSLSILLKSLPIMMDMQIKLLENRTSKELITSDNPISKYNQFLEFRKFPYSHTGIASKGLQVFYPIAPDLMLVMYDPKVYKIGNKKQFSNILMNEEDVKNLNRLTSLHANKTLYSTDNVSDFQFEQILEGSNKFEAQRKLKTRQFNPVPIDGNTESIVVQNYRTPYMIKLNLSFVKQTQHAKSYQLSGYYAELRDERYRNPENRPTF
ncbi:DUF4238 domain-containing protein [Winogradskyella sp. 4-2091]|uniref:DUF4238 domain-containing protein n=1 Tax=Winogradskyella sp. 4-2091 TaxID=3381659 RepID=UPI003891F8E5